MELGTLLLILLLLACPLMMVFMHRGGHGHGAHGDHEHGQGRTDAPSLDELRGRRDEIDVEIARLEEMTSETKSPTVV